jgi:hypothetical protein
VEDAATAGDATERNRARVEASATRLRFIGLFSQVDTEGFVEANPTSDS